MSTNHQPYIGITGFMHRSEVDAALAAFPSGTGRLLMVGVLASSKTLAGGTNKYPRRYPKVEDIAGIFSPDPRCLNLVHYATDTPPGMVELMRLFDLAGPCCHGFQFNVSWPYRGDLMRLRGAFEARGQRPRFVLQVNDRTGEPDPIHYDGAVTDLLLDASGGRGMVPSLPALRVKVNRATSAWSRGAQYEPALGIAGGFYADTLPAFAPLIREHDLSFDMEGRVRDDADGGGNLDAGKVESALAEAGRLLREGQA